jgi:hypothetical protein
VPAPAPQEGSTSGVTTLESAHPFEPSWRAVDVPSGRAQRNSHDRYHGIGERPRPCRMRSRWASARPWYAIEYGTAGYEQSPQGPAAGISAAVAAAGAGRLTRDHADGPIGVLTLTIGPAKA